MTSAAEFLINCLASLLVLEILHFPSKTGPVLTVLSPLNQPGFLQTRDPTFSEQHLKLLESKSFNPPV